MTSTAPGEGCLITAVNRRQFLKASRAGLVFGVIAGHGCAAHRAPLSEGSRAAVSAGGLTVHVHALAVSEWDDRALEAEVVMKNEGDRSLEFAQKHVSLVDADGRSVPAVVNRPIQWKRPENHLFEPGDSAGMRAFKVITLPLAVIGGLLVLPVMLPVGLAKHIGEPSRSWKPYYSATAIVAAVGPHTDIVVQWYFDRAGINSQQLAAMNVRHPTTDQTMVIRLAK